MKIGLISDTHGLLLPSVVDHFKTVDYIFHAGDVGKMDIINELEKMATVKAVTGNMDDWNIKKSFPIISFTSINNWTICLVHDIGNMKKFCFELFKKNKKADIIIHGHTHRPSYETYQSKVFINPGSSTHPRTLNAGTIAILNLNEKEISHHFITLD